MKRRMALKTIHLESHGDFYEAFNQDAKDIAEALKITLTSRGGMPMAGVPKNAVSQYIDKLNMLGFTIKFNTPLPV